MPAAACLALRLPPCPPTVHLPACSSLAQAAGMGEKECVNAEKKACAVAVVAACRQKHPSHAGWVWEV